MYDDAGTDLWIGDLSMDCLIMAKGEMNDEDV